MFSPRSLSLLLSFSFSRVRSTESALERLRDDDDDVENDLSRETSTESWILEEHGEDENSTQRRRKKKTTF